MRKMQETTRDYDGFEEDKMAVSCFQEVEYDYWSQYFGARYYDPNISIWLSVDPLSDKAPGLTPYRYAMNNPIRLIDPNGMFEDWYENEETGQLVWKNSEEETITDDAGTWNNVGSELITFDGNDLTYYTQEKDEEGNLSLKGTTFEAASGRQQEDGTFDYSEKAQATPFTGPLPEGDYSISPSEIQWWADQSIPTKTAAFIGKGQWPGGLISWGNARVWLNPQEVNVIDPSTGLPIMRNNFSIHGGWVLGSAGCIDMTSNDLPFFRMLGQSKESNIKVRVNY